MNQPTTTPPLTTTGDLIDQFNQTEWNDVDDWEGPTEAGLGLKAYVEQLEAVSQEKYQRQRRQVELLSILWPELKKWIESWNLGLSFEAVYREAKQRVYVRVEQSTPQQNEWMDALLLEAKQNLPMPEQAVRQRVVPMLASMLTKMDYEALAEIAAEDMAIAVMKQGQAILSS